MERNREDLIGRRLWDVANLPPNSPLGEFVRQVAADHSPAEAELTYRKVGRLRLLSVRAFPVGEEIVVVWRDITAARAAERRLALSEARYREIADSLPAAAWLSRADGKLEFINQAMADALGRPRRALLGEGWIECIDPEDQPHLLQVRAEARENHSEFHYEGRFRRPDGAMRIIELYGRPRFDAQGSFRGHVGIAKDVTDARAAERHHRLLINELNHRVKNTLATVQSLVRHTLRDHGAPNELERAVAARLVALAAAHDLLSREHWNSAGLADLIRGVMQPYAERLSVAGPEVRISPKTAIALSMGLHELATNAAKHGALSTDHGHVEISWSRRGDAVALQWRESGGPPKTSPKPSGFGALLLGRMLADELGHPGEMVYAPDGLICRLQAPAAG